MSEEETIGSAQLLDLICGLVVQKWEVMLAGELEFGNFEASNSSTSSCDVARSHASPLFPTSFVPDLINIILLFPYFPILIYKAGHAFLPSPQARSFIDTPAH